MQKELNAAKEGMEIHILGVNADGEESGNGLATDGNDIPWLQDTEDADVWSSWEVTRRDVVILDRENRKVAVYNVTTHPLGSEANYEALKALLQQFAAPD